MQQVTPDTFSHRGSRGLTPSDPAAAATARRDARRALELLGAWAGAALAITMSGALTLARPVVPLVIVSAVAGTAIAYRRRGSVRRAIDAVPTRTLILFHTVRAPIGILFLFELTRGRLPEAFATRAGWGDFVVGLAAPLVAWWATSRVANASAARQLSDGSSSVGHRDVVRAGVLSAFSIAGILDILVAFATAQYAFLVEHDPLITAAIGRLPYGLLPTFIVPLVMITHGITLARVRGTRIE